tara:strand:- start:7162 stop:7371 length:210 start_codon:yes stop_codon:yes gene_type:complete
MDEFKLSLEDEKYLCKLNKMNALDIFKLHNKEDMKLEEAASHSDFILYKLIEHNYKIIEYVILNRMTNN